MFIWVIQRVTAFHHLSLCLIAALGAQVIHVNAGHG